MLRLPDEKCNTDINFGNITYILNKTQLPTYYILGTYITTHRSDQFQQEKYFSYTRLLI